LDKYVFGHHGFGRHGCGRHGHCLWPSWFVAVIVEPPSTQPSIAPAGYVLMIMVICAYDECMLFVCTVQVTSCGYSVNWQRSAVNLRTETEC